MKTGLLDEAKAAFQRIIEREPRAKEAYSNLAVVCMESGDQGTAEALFRETMEKFPRYVFPRTNLAQICLRRGQVEEAEKLLEPLDRLQKFTSGEFRFYVLTWSDILAAQGNYEAAQSWLRLLSKTLLSPSGLWGRRVRYGLGRVFRRGRGKEQE
ncbi:MAG: tetratricopeptide repeat protein [Chloroflexi bacterium]|nr:tetratricopeptide repeat protein [Chloroflexota bacterium]